MRGTSASRIAGLTLSERSLAEVSQLLVDGVSGGKLRLLNPDRHLEGVGDGILVLSGSTATISRSRVVNAARAGILFDRSSGVPPSGGGNATRPWSSPPGSQMIHQPPARQVSCSRFAYLGVIRGLASLLL